MAGRRRLPSAEDDHDAEGCRRRFTGDEGGVSHAIRRLLARDGEITSAGDNFSHDAYTFDGQGNVASVDNAGTPGVPDVVLSSSFDAAGNRKSLGATIGGTADFLNNYSYDTLSRLYQITQQGQTGGNAVAPKSIYFGLDSIGDVTGIYRSNFVDAGPTETGPGYSLLSYDATTGLLTGINHIHTGTSLDNLTYTHDTLGRVSTFGSIDGTATYGYDPTSQLTSASYTTVAGGTQPPNFSVTFDPNGNRTAVNSTSTTVSPNNQVTSDGTFTYQFDPEGNRVSRQRISTASANDYLVTYTWDYRNRLTDAENFNNSGVLTQHVHYVYDVWDHLIERDLDPNGSGTYTQIVHYVWDGDNIALAFNGSDQLIARYLNGPNTSAFDQYFTTLAEEDVTSPTSPGAVTFPLPDQQGSVVDIVDANGNLVDHVVYVSTGGVWSESNPSVPHLTSWQGGLLDAVTGMENFYHRWYVLADGVWANQDPLGFLAGDMNLTRSRGNDPSNLSDSSGLEPDVAVDENGSLIRVGGEYISPKDIGNDSFDGQGIPVKLAIAIRNGDQITYLGAVQRADGLRGRYRISHTDGSQEEVVGPVASRDAVAAQNRELQNAKMNDQLLGAAETTCKVGKTAGDAADIALLVITLDAAAPVVAGKKMLVKKLSGEIAEQTCKHGDDIGRQLISNGCFVTGTMVAAYGAGADDDPREAAFADIGAAPEQHPDERLMPLAAAVGTAGLAATVIQERRRRRAIGTAGQVGSEDRGATPLALPRSEGPSPHANRPRDGALAHVPHLIRFLTAHSVGGCFVVMAILAALWGYRHSWREGDPRATQSVHWVPPSTQSGTLSAVRMIPIEELTEGQSVLARSEETDEIAPRRVTHVFKHTVRQLRILSIRDADGEAVQLIKTTDNHPFWVDGKGWVEAGQLAVGATFVQSDGRPATLLSTISEPHPAGVDVYNIEVEGFHTYYVSATGSDVPVWVHNKAKSYTPPKTPRAARREAMREQGIPTSP